MSNKTKIAFCAAVVLSIAFPAWAATKHHHRVTHVRAGIIYNMVPNINGVCPANGGPSCSSACTGSGPCAPPDSW
jgi:hypothetical protein